MAPSVATRDAASSLLGESSLDTGLEETDDLVPRALDRISSLDPELRAFTFVDAVPPQPAKTAHGDLQNLPIAVKDVIDVKGMPTTASSEVLPANLAQRDAPAVSRLRDAGAVIVGKTNLDEFAYGVFSPPTRNPWHSDHVPGGSSGGSAAAVASGMCAGALGTDTAGSIRIPAALCGVVGLKPRRTVDMTGIVPLAPSLDVCGPIARDPACVAALWQVMTVPRITAPQEAFRVGVFDADDLDIDPDVVFRYAEFVDSLQRDRRYEVIVKELPPLDHWERPGGIVLAREAWEVHVDRGWWPEKSSLYTPAVRTNLEAAARMGPEEVEGARYAMNGLRQEFEVLMRGIDIAVMPTTPCLAPKRDQVVGRGRRAWVKRLTRFAAPLNFCPLAAVTIPVWGVDGDLPWGVDAIAADEWSALDFALAAAPASRIARS